MRRKKKSAGTASAPAQNAAAPAQTAPAVASEAPVRLKLLVTVVNRSKTEFYADYLQSNFHINFQTILAAEGTADSDTLRLLGLTDRRDLQCCAGGSGTRCPDGAGGKIRLHQERERHCLHRPADGYHRGCHLSLPRQYYRLSDRAQGREIYHESFF